METSGRVGSEKLMIIIPGTVLLFVIVIVTGGPTQFLRTVNFELGLRACDLPPVVVPVLMRELGS